MSTICPQTYVCHIIPNMRQIYQNRWVQNKRKQTKIGFRAQNEPKQDRIGWTALGVPKIIEIFGVIDNQPRFVTPPKKSFDQPAPRGIDMPKKSGKSNQPIMKTLAACCGGRGDRSLIFAWVSKVRKGGPDAETVLGYVIVLRCNVAIERSFHGISNVQFFWSKCLELFPPCASFSYYSERDIIRNPSRHTANRNLGTTWKKQSKKAPGQVFDSSPPVRVSRSFSLCKRAV
jgi:hypothetical protein